MSTILLKRCNRLSAASVGKDVKIASRCYGEFLVYTESGTFSTFKAFAGLLNEKADETGAACRQAAETLLLAKINFDMLHSECGKDG